MRRGIVLCSSTIVTKICLNCSWLWVWSRRKQWGLSLMFRFIRIGILRWLKGTSSFRYLLRIVLFHIRSISLIHNGIERGIIFTWGMYLSWVRITTWLINRLKTQIFFLWVLFTGLGLFTRFLRLVLVHLDVSWLLSVRCSMVVCWTVLMLLSWRFVIYLVLRRCSLILRRSNLRVSWRGTLIFSGGLGRFLLLILWFLDRRQKMRLMIRSFRWRP